MVQTSDSKVNGSWVSITESSVTKLGYHNLEVLMWVLCGCGCSVNVDGLLNIHSFFRPSNLRFWAMKLYKQDRPHSLKDRLLSSMTEFSFKQTVHFRTSVHRWERPLWVWHLKSITHKLWVIVMSHANTFIKTYILQKNAIFTISTK